MPLQNGMVSVDYTSSQTDVFQPHSIKSQPVHTAVCFPSTAAPSTSPQERVTETIKRERSACTCGTGRLMDGHRPDVFSENENCSCQSSDEDIGRPDNFAMCYRRADGSYINRRALGSG